MSLCCVPGTSLILLHFVIKVLSHFMDGAWGTEHFKDQITQLRSCGVGIQTCVFLILVPIMLPFDEFCVHGHFSCGVIAYEV